MTAYLIRRVAHAVVVLWAAFTVTFFIMNLTPGSPLLSIIGAQNISATPPSEIAQLNKQFGFNKPILVRYWSQLWALVRGNLGTSYETRGSVSHMLAQALPYTLELALAALVLGVVFGAIVAIVAYYTRIAWLGSVLLVLPPLGAGIPTFWSGLVLLEVVSFHWRLVPAAGDQGLSTLVLPAITLGIPLAAVLAQVFAEGLRNTLAEPYVQVVTAKGASRTRVHFGHAIRNASLPALTVLGVLVGAAFGGAVVVEQVFSRNGIGRVALAAVETKDIPVVQGVVVLAATAYVVVNLLVDLVYPVVDPRIRLWGKRN